MQYIVSKKFGRGPETRVDSFQDLVTAKKCIQEKLAEDVSHKITTTVYCLYEGMDLLEQFDQSKLEASADDQGSQQSNSSKFTPSPFSTTPQPSGLPRSYIKDDEKKDNKS